MRYDRQDHRHDRRVDDKTFKPSGPEEGRHEDRNFKRALHDEDADSELRFQARHRAPYETYSPYTDEDYGSNARTNNSDYNRNDWDERSSQPQSSFGSAYRYDQSTNGMTGGSISFGRRTGGPMDYSTSNTTEVDSGRFSGVGPKGYMRSDERIHEEVCEILTRHPSIDASEIECQVANGEITLSGFVPERRMKYLAEEAIEHCHGIKDIHNHLKATTAASMESATNVSETAPLNPASSSEGMKKLSQQKDKH